MRRIYKTRIATQLLVWFVAVALVPLALATYITYRSSEQAMTAEVTNNLVAIGQRQANQIERYLRERERSVTALSHSTDMSDAMAQLAAVFHTSGPDASAYAALEGTIRRFLEHYNELAGYDDTYLISLQGRVVFSARQRSDFGADLRAAPYRETELARVFERALMLMATELSDFALYAPAGKPVVFLATPLFKHPRLVGVVAFQLSTDEVYRVVNDYTGLGRTGETVIAARHGNEAVIITPIRHDPEAAFHRAVRIGSALGRPLQEAVQARKGTGIAVDDRGRETLAIWKYIPYLRWGMVVQIDTAEAFAPVTRLRTAAAVIVVATVLLVVLAAVCVSRSFANPIVRLTAMTKALAGGDLSRRVDVPAGNEIGELAASFNDMASQLAASIERLRETTTAKERIESELKVARDIQMSMVPKIFPAFPDRSEVDIYGRIVPAREVGGDLYDFFFLDEEHLCFAIGDVSGKGVPASLFMAVTQTLLRATASTSRGPDEILYLLNRELCRDNETCMFVTLFCGILDLHTGIVHYSNGGHNLPYVCTLQGNRTVPGAQGTALGLVDEAVYHAREVVLAPGDVFFLYTDGITEAMDGAGHLFTEARLESCLHRVACLPGAALTQAVTDEVDAFMRGAPQSDDLTILALRYLGPRDAPAGTRLAHLSAAGP